ncbi:MAG: LysE family transporter [Prochloraceae cyanobacterium]|nr:LysE family transporter [Prochloraceae cyanobacterium]
MSIYMLKSGLSIGFAVAAPIGVIGVLCINRSLLQGTLIGFISGLGAASAHSLYSFIAGLGLECLSEFLAGKYFLLEIFGALFLCYFGTKVFLKKPPKKDINIQKISLKTAYLSTFLAALTNPQTIFSFLAMFSTSEAIAIQNSFSVATTIVGVFLGSALWWLFLTTLVGSISRWITPKRIRIINYISGVIIISFGLKILL